MAEHKVQPYGSERNDPSDAHHSKIVDKKIGLGTMGTWLFDFDFLQKCFVNLVGKLYI